MYVSQQYLRQMNKNLKYLYLAVVGIDRDNTIHSFIIAIIENIVINITIDCHNFPVYTIRLIRDNYEFSDYNQRQQANLKCVLLFSLKYHHLKTTTVFYLINDLLWVLQLVCLFVYVY